MSSSGQATAASQERQLNLCLIGYGFTAKVLHITLIKQVSGLRIYSVVQRHPTPGNDATEDLGVKVLADWREAVADPEVDVVVILTGNQLHYEMTKGALEAGKHVLVEKPFTTSHAQALELVKLAEEKGKVLTVYHNRRLDSDFLTLRKLLRDPEQPIGPIHEIYTSFNRYKPPTSSNTGGKAWKVAKVPGNGLVWDLGIHLVDQALVLFGIPDRVWGHMRDRTGTGEKLFGDEGFQDDWFMAGLEYDAGRPGWAKEGGVVRLEAGCLKIGVPIKYEVQGELGTYLKSGFDAQEDHLRVGKIPGEDGFGADSAEKIGRIVRPNGHTEEYAANEFGGYVKIYENLRDVILGNADKLTVPALEAADAVRIVELIGKSAREGRTLSTLE